jgi:PAS domain S-box-containing protein
VQNVLVAAGIRLFIKSPLSAITLRDALIFILVAVVIVPFGTAFWGAALTLSYHYGTDFWVEWRKLGISNGVTLTVLVPVILLSVHHFTAQRIKATRAQMFEAGILGAGILVVGTIVFVTLSAGPGNSPALLYTPIPFLIWAALRFGLFGASVCMLVITFQSIGGAIRGNGPFFMQTRAENAIALQAFLFITSIPLFILAVAVEEEKRSQGALLESEARFGKVANSAPVLIWMSGTDKLCNYFNQVWLDFTGRTLEQELGNGWAESVHPDDLAGCLKTYAESFDTRRSFTMEYRLRRHDGEYCWFSDHGIPRYDPHQEFLGYIGSCVDLTERKRAEEKFRQVVEAAPNGIILIDSQDRIILVNKEAELQFGHPRDELIGCPIKILLPEQLYVTLQVHVPGIGHEPFARRKDGTEFPIEIGVSRIQGESEDHLLIVVVDNTARKQAEVELLRQRAELAHVARVSTMGELAASVAHELNQPLGAILANASAAELFLAQDPPAFGEVRAILADIRKDDERAGQVIQRMRALLRKHELERAPLEINSVVSDVMLLISSDAALRKMTIKADLAPVLPVIVGDGVHLQQVLLNLIMNAMDAMASQPHDRRRICVRTRACADWLVELSVTDLGHGIDPEKLPRLFEPFFTTKPNGMGMGLSIARTIVEAHHGRIWAENHASGGAVFRIALPVTKEEAKP